MFIVDDNTLHTEVASDCGQECCSDCDCNCTVDGDCWDE